MEVMTARLSAYVMHVKLQILEAAAGMYEKNIIHQSSKLFGEYVATSQENCASHCYKLQQPPFNFPVEL